MAGDLSNWHILSLLQEDFLQKITWIAVFGTTGNEAILLTREDEVFVLGANTSSCLGLERSAQIGLQPKRLDNLCGKNIIYLTCGCGPHVLALTKEGEVYSWGHNGYGQLGHGSTAAATPVKFSNRITEGLNNLVVRKIACGAFHSLALSENGEVFTWGFNNCGQLGCGDLTSRYSPTKLNGLLESKRCHHITSSYASSFVLTNEGEVYSWGQNSSGQLGIGSTTQQLQPCIVPFFKTTVKKIVAGYSHVLVLSVTGDLFSWGANTHGQLGNGTKQCLTSPGALTHDARKFAEIAASHLCHISAGQLLNGKVLMWGECYHQNIITPLETTLPSVDEVYARFASPPCSWRPFLSVRRNKQTSVSKCIEKRFDDPETADIIFKIEGQTIHVHRALLRMRCSYFYSMLQEGKWIEGQKDTLEITDQSYKIFHSFLKYLYTDKIELEPEDTIDLLQLADLYCENSLKDQCDKIMCAQIDQDNVLSLYISAVRCRAKELENACFNFAMKNSTAVIKSTAFADMNETDVKKFVLKLAENGAFKS